MIIPNEFLSKDFYPDFSRFIDQYPGLEEYDPYQLEDDGFLNQTQSEIIEEKDTISAFYFAYHTRYHLFKSQQLILEQKDAKYAYLFAKYIVGSDTKRLQAIVQASDNIKLLVQFACLVPGAKKGKIENAILRSGKARFAYMLMKHLNPSNIEKFRELILKSKRPRFIFEFAKQLVERGLTNKKEMAKIERLIVASKSPMYIRMFAKTIPFANIRKLEDAILESEDLIQIEKFAKGVKRSRLQKMSVLF